MIFSLFLIIIIGLIIYFHSMQGLFSAGLSAGIALIAAVAALAWHETLVDLLLRGQFSDEANALTLVMIFSVVYILLRVLFDKVVPGNVLFPVLLDKIGASVCGLIAGICAAGIF